jgi:outer membrane protein TolC
MFDIANSKYVLPTAGAAVLVIVVFLSGCSRSHYRKQADEEAQQLITEKSNDPRWALPCFSIEMDDRSRYYDPYDRDYPPMPPDDQFSHRLMHRLAGKKGFKHWHDYGQISELENPCWRDYLATSTEQTEDGVLKLRLEDAVQLGLIHAPNYQEQLETLYLSALDVSTERFRFDVQFFGGNDTIFEHLGGERSLIPERNTLTTNTDFQMRRRLATAGEVLVGFANSTVWQFFGPDTGFTTSLLNFSLVQPLLRAGGRAVALEQLTIAERSLLANLRAFQRYRQGFYTRVAIGTLGVTGPQRRGGFFGGTGLTGFTGQGSGGFGGVGAATGFGRGGLGTADGGGTGGAASGFAGGGAGTVGGYIGLLQQLQQIRNTQDSLGLQLKTLALLEANLEAGLIDIAQVDQFRQSIETERANLLQADIDLETAQDTFKSTTLGLPPDLPFELDDTLIRPFQLITPRISKVQNSISSLIKEFGNLPQEPTLESLENHLQRLVMRRQQVAEQFEAVLEDLKSLERKSKQRQQGMSAAERKRFLADRKRLADNLKELHTRFEKTAVTLGQLQSGLNPRTRVKTADQLIVLMVDLSNLVGEMTLVQARTRLEAVTVEPIVLASSDALDIARANRLDWMNNRAALVDTWRLIEFNATALKSNLTVRFSGDIQTLGGDNPMKFRDETGTLRASVEFDAPFTRLVERNNFRQQLIEYQQDRRQLIQFEDGVHRTLRQTLRQLKYLQANLEIQRRAVAIAIRRVDETRENLNQPVPPAQPGQPPVQFGPTAALNLLTALSDLRSSQNAFMSVWLNFYASRMTLMRELGIMRIGEDGLWIDESLDMARWRLAQECPLPPVVPSEWILDEDDRGMEGDGFTPPEPMPSVEESALRPDRKSTAVEKQASKAPKWNPF